MNKVVQMIRKEVKQLVSRGKEKAELLGVRGLILAALILALCVFQSGFVCKIQDYTAFNVTYHTVTEIVIFLVMLLLCRFAMGEGWKVSLKTVLLMGFPILIMFVSNVIVLFQGQHMQIYGLREMDVHLGIYSLTVNPFFIIIPIDLFFIFIAMERQKNTTVWAFHHICGITSCVFVWGSSMGQMGIVPLLVGSVVVQCVLAYAGLWLLRKERHAFAYDDLDDDVWSESEKHSDQEANV